MLLPFADRFCRNNASYSPSLKFVPHTLLYHRRDGFRFEWTPLCIVSPRTAVDASLVARGLTSSCGKPPYRRNTDWTWCESAAGFLRESALEICRQRRRGSDRQSRAVVNVLCMILLPEIWKFGKSVSSLHEQEEYALDLCLLIRVFLQHAAL